jgi:4-hydroxyphenylacetate 3-monooxygenase
MIMRTTPLPTTATRPFTGAKYLESLRGRRDIWNYGEQVKDLTTHPAFRNAARMLAACTTRFPNVDQQNTSLLAGLLHNAWIW